MKKMNILRISLFFLLSLFSSPIFAQFIIDAQYRPRFEVRDGYKTLNSTGAAPAVLVSQRFRLGMKYQTDKLILHFTPQDVRIWGEEHLSSSTGVFGDASSLDLFEGFAELNLGKIGWLSVGRQQLVYDGQRLLAARNWNQNGLAYDAVVLKSAFDNWKLHIGASWNSTGDILTDNLYDNGRIKSLNFLWLNRKFQEKYNVSFSYIASGVTETDTTNALHFLQTTGIYSDFTGSAFSYRTNVYFQYGKNNQGINKRAFLVDVDVAYKSGQLKPGLGLSYLSGNKSAQSSIDHLFDILNGARHSYFGHMDYFRSFSSQTQGGGLIDIFAYLNLKLGKPWNLKNTGHYFRLAQSNENTPSQKNLGYENEVELSYSLNEWVKLKASYLFFLPTESLKMLQGVSGDHFSQYAFVELTLTPKLFTHNADN